MITVTKPEDVPALNELVNAAYRGDDSRKGWTSEADFFDGIRTNESMIGQILKKPGHQILQYADQGKLLGCVEVHKEGKKLYLGMLCVRPDLQGGGIGKKLVAAAEDEAVKQDCEAVFMTVLTIRHELIQWYKRLGYSDTGVRRPFEVPEAKAKFPLELAVLEKPM